IGQKRLASANITHIIASTTELRRARIRSSKQQMPRIEPTRLVDGPIPAMWASNPLRDPWLRRQFHAQTRQTARRKSPPRNQTDGYCQKHPLAIVIRRFGRVATPPSILLRLLGRKRCWIPLVARPPNSPAIREY